ncbi:MAG: transglycosylase SLT domain-containing protein [Proteobacteria bacterium]|nr:transglycosylase SLT domain-containing protein [Pseudomonadota bacterium]
MAVLGGGCTALGAACLLLAACSTTPRKPLVAAPAPEPVIAPVGAMPAPVDTQTPAAVEDTSSWTRLSRRFTFDDCGYSPDVARLAHWFSADPTGFAESLRQSLPFLLYVAKHLEEREMPGEFALLPYIESNYVPIASSGDHAAGIWQLLPDTAREGGLHIGGDYDGRLDIAASTDAALTLLERYYDRFGDWRVADMAFNAGPYRIAKLLGNGAVPSGAAELGRLRVDAHTHRHLAKLLAVACIVSDPARFDVKLPEPATGDRLTAISLPAAVDLQLAARVAGLDPARLRQLNPGYVRGRMPASGPFHLLLPEAQSRALSSALEKLPQSLWGEWHEITLRQTESLGVLAQAHDVDDAVLATANALVPETALDAGMRVLVPGRDPIAPTAVAVSRQMPHDRDTHIVRAGDSLWRIARAAHVALPDLLQWNDLTRNANLHPGQRLRLRAPERGGTASTVVASPN